MHSHGDGADPAMGQTLRGPVPCKCAQLVANLTLGSGALESQRKEDSPEFWAFLGSLCTSRSPAKKGQKPRNLCSFLMSHMAGARKARWSPSLQDLVRAMRIGTAEAPFHRIFEQAQAATHLLLLVIV